MKKIQLAFMMLLLVLASSVFTVQAQADDKDKRPGKEKQEMAPGDRLKKMIPDLSENQIAKIKEISLAHKKSVQETRNLLREKEAHLETLQTKDNPNMGEINKAIDEIGALRIQMHKSSAQHRQDVRNLLTPSQKLAFDKIKPREMMREGREGGPDREGMKKGDRKGEKHGKPGNDGQKD